MIFDETEKLDEARCTNDADEEQRFRIWDVTGAVSQPIFQAGRLRAQIRKAKALRGAAIKNFKATTLQAFSEVENSLSGEKFIEEEEAQLEKATAGFT